MTVKSVTPEEVVAYGYRGPMFLVMLRLDPKRSTLVDDDGMLKITTDGKVACVIGPTFWKRIYVSQKK